MKFNTITRSIGRSALKTKKNSPHIFFGLGLIGVVGSTVLACRATLKLEETLDEAKKDLDVVKALATKATSAKTEYSEQEYYKDLGYVYTKSVVKLAKLYGPAVAIGGVSIAALTGSHVQLTRRNTALTVTLAAVSKAYQEYRERVKEELGSSRELEIFSDIRKETTEIDGKKAIVKVAGLNGFSPYARFFDEYSSNWQKDPEMNRIFLQCQQNYANHMLKARGHVFLNDVYDSLGLERTQAGAVVGWIYDGDGDGYIDFGMFEVSNNRFINGLERSVLLDFNVDGVVYDKI